MRGHRSAAFVVRSFDHACERDSFHRGGVREAVGSASADVFAVERISSAEAEAYETTEAFMVMMSSTSLLRLGTRGSLLAWSQSQIIANAIEAKHRSTRVEVVIYRTTGDDIVDRPLD